MSGMKDMLPGGERVGGLEDWVKSLTDEQTRLTATIHALANDLLGLKSTLRVTEGKVFQLQTDMDGVRKAVFPAGAGAAGPANLFQQGRHLLHSGDTSGYKIDCDALTKKDWECLAVMVTERVPPFCDVLGVPRGGTKLAEALRPYVTPDVDLTLIVDDVLTTGRSMNEARRFIPAGREYCGAVAFSRCAWGKIPPWITPVFFLTPPRGQTP